MREYKEALEGLNPSQSAAVSYRDSGHLLVLAGPGSGKTLTITRRIGYLLAQGRISPEKILAVTFTRDAASSMRDRFFRENTQFSPAFLQTVNFGTFHSVFYQILRQSNRFTDRQILTNADRRGILRSALSVAVPKSSAQERSYYEKDLLMALSYYKNTKDRAGTVRRTPQSFQEEIWAIHETYERLRRGGGKMDFDDMLSDCWELLAGNRGILEYWQSRFEEILIDEFQDCNPVQYEIVRLLCGQGGHSVFAVGDDDQSIYGFRGASPACMQRFLKEFGAEKILLGANYRSGKEIVHASLKVIGDNRERFSKELSSAKERTGEVRVLGFSDSREQTAFLIRRCREKGECAVLFRTNRLMSRFAKRLQRAGIAYEMREKGGNPYDDERVRDVMAYLQLGSGMGGAELLTRIINRPSRYVDREAFRSMGEGVKSAGDALSRLKEYDRRGDRRMAAGLEELEGQLARMRTMPPYLAVQYVRRVIGYEAWILERYEKMPQARLEALEILDWLGEEAREYQSLAEWLEEQRECEKSLQKTEKARSEIKLMTVHAAKGLEFEHVILPDCNEGIYPYGKLLDEETVEEERRIFYVGMTRAKTTLDLLYLLGSREHPRERSRFLGALSDHNSSSNSALSRNSSNASLTISYSSSSAM